MADEKSVRLVARDLTRYLEKCSPNLDGPIYAIALFIEDLYADFYVSIATERGYDRLRQDPRYRQCRDEVLAGPAGLRWNSGDWEVCADSFLNTDTNEALASLAVLVRDDSAALGAAVTEEARRRWAEIGYGALDLAQPLTLLSTTPTAIAFAQFPEYSAVESAEVMQRTVPMKSFHSLFPAWRRLAEEARSARADARHMLERKNMTPHVDRFPQVKDAPPDELTALLGACGLHWTDVTEWSDRMRRALAIADKG